MPDKSLKTKAISIKGKQYVLVADRVIYFNEQYPNGCIRTLLLTDYESDLVIVKAIVTPNVVDNPARTFEDYSQAIKGDGLVNKTAALENASTSAVGRALAYMGIGVLDSIASVDEINKAQGSVGKKPVKFATAKQIDWLRSEAAKVTGLEEGGDLDEWIKEVLTLEPQRIPIFKIGDAVDKIRKIGEELDNTLGPVNGDAVKVTDKDIKDLEDGKLAY